MGKKKDFEERLYDDFFSSQMYQTVNRAGNVIGKIVNKAVNEGLDHLEKTDFYKKAVPEQEGRDFVNVDPQDVREAPPQPKEPPKKDKKHKK